MSRASTPRDAVAAMTAAELTLSLRRGENLVATIVIPSLVLLLFASVSILPTGAGRPVDFLLPGSIALAIIATSFVSLGIVTAYDRHYGVLKRLGGSPLTRLELIVAKILAVLVIETTQVVLLVAIAAVLLGWRPGPDASPILGFVAVLAGTLAFAGLGLLIAGALRAETVLALANVAFLGFLVLGGVVVPVDHLPGPVASLASMLPAAALSNALRAALGSAAAGEAGGSIALLLLWGVVATVVAARTFAWE